MSVKYTHNNTLSAFGGVMVSKLDLQTYTNEFESHWVPHSYGFVPHLSKMLSKLQLITTHCIQW